MDIYKTLFIYIMLSRKNGTNGKYSPWLADSGKTEASHALPPVAIEISATSRYNVSSVPLGKHEKMVKVMDIAALMKAMAHIHSYHTIETMPLSPAGESY